MFIREATICFYKVKPVYLFDRQALSLFPTEGYLLNYFAFFTSSC